MIMKYGLICGWLRISVSFILVPSCHQKVLEGYTQIEYLRKQILEFNKNQYDW